MRPIRSDPPLWMVRFKKRFESPEYLSFMTVSELHIVNKDLGTLHFGLRPEGTQGWSWEPQNGGAVVIPYAVLQEKLYVGMLYEERPFAGGFVWNVLREGSKQNERSFETAIRGLQEEMGIVSQGRIFQLDGEPANWGSTHIETWEEGKGSEYFALEIFPEELEKDGEEYTLKEQTIPHSQVGEVILGCAFHPWWMAGKVSDNFSGMAFARLINTKRELIAFLK